MNRFLQLNIDDILCGSLKLSEEVAFVYLLERHGNAVASVHQVGNGMAQIALYSNVFGEIVGFDTLVNTEEKIIVEMTAASTNQINHKKLDGSVRVYPSGGKAHQDGGNP